MIIPYRCEWLLPYSVELRCSGSGPPTLLCARTRERSQKGRRAKGEWESALGDGKSYRALQRDTERESKRQKTTLNCHRHLVVVRQEPWQRPHTPGRSTSTQCKRSLCCCSTRVKDRTTSLETEASQEILLCDRVCVGVCVCVWIRVSKYGCAYVSMCVSVRLWVCGGINEQRKDRERERERGKRRSKEVYNILHCCRTQLKRYIAAIRAT